MATVEENIKFARRGPLVSILAYLALTIGKLVFGHLLNSSSLTADGFNNLSDHEQCHPPGWSLFGQSSCR